MELKTTGPLPEVWGGIECSINRINNTHHDQLELADFYSKPAYLDEIIAAGFKTLRFPVLWERHQPQANQKIDWSRTTAQLSKLRLHGITPIAGLLHHGSGPIFTDLLKPNFPEQFARYALLVAEQFPWLEYYTPVNEPLTTARFSGLYGFWYPHKKNDVSFIRILLNELKATVLAMEAIRKINHLAKLVQTEDLGKTYSTPLLAYQAAFENHRRWLTFDILCGQFNSMHPLWNYFKRLGIENTLLDFFLLHPCPPDIIGANYYATSERYLDEHCDEYAAHTKGGNTLHDYADVEAIRVNIAEPNGPSVLLKELYQRYHLPIAITEVHLHCSREEQLRWLQYLYETAQNLSAEIDLRAITVWALLGSYGWDQLLTSLPGNYEPGAFDISAGYPRPTAILEMTRKLLSGDLTAFALNNGKGWWQMDERLYQKIQTSTTGKQLQFKHPVLIIGKNGVLGKALVKECATRNIYAIATSSKELNIGNSESIEENIKRYSPRAIINAAGYIDIDTAEISPDDCYRINTLGSHKLGIACQFHNIKLVSFSSDMVFDGCKKKPYIESDTPGPLNNYGKSKLLAEQFLANVNPDGLIIRTSAFFTQHDNNNGFISKVLLALEAGKQVNVSTDIVSPTYVPHLAFATMDLLIDNCNGIWHLANKGQISWLELAKRVALNFGADPELINASIDNTTVKRPAFAALASERYGLMPSLEDALFNYFNQLAVTV